MLPRLMRRAFWDLAIWMVGLTLSVGTVFPFPVLFFGVPACRGGGLPLMMPERSANGCGM